jgi:hypothetical protein
MYGSGTAMIGEEGTRKGLGKGRDKLKLGLYGSYPDVKRILHDNKMIGRD